MQGAPQGGEIAFVGPAPQREYPSVNTSEQLILYTVAFPEVEPHPQITVFSSEILNQLVDDNPSSANDLQATAWWKIEQIRAAVTRAQSMAWSPTAINVVALSAALDGGNSDVYLLNLGTGRTMRLTSGGTQATNLSWSPDGQYVIHKAVSDINVGRSGPGLIVDGLWAAAADGSAPRFLAEGNASPVGWISPTEVLVQHWTQPCEFNNLEFVDVATGNKRLLWKGPFLAVAFDPESRTALLTNPFSPSPDDPLCPSENQPGIYLFEPLSPVPHQVTDYSDFDYFHPARWSRDLGSFVVPTMAGFLYVTPRGRVQGAEPSGAVAQSELIARNDNYCNLTELPDHSAFAFSDDTTVYVARQPDFWPRAIVSNLDDLCSFDLEWVAK